MIIAGKTFTRIVNAKPTGDGRSMSEYKTAVLVNVENYDNTDEWWELFRNDFHIAVDRAFDGEDNIVRMEADFTYEDIKRFLGK